MGGLCRRGKLAPELAGVVRADGLGGLGVKGRLVAVVVGLKRALRVDADVGGLGGVELGKAAAEAFEVEPGYFFVEVFGQHFDADGFFAAVLPQFDLGEYLVGEGCGHDEAGVAGGTAQIDEAAFGQDVDAVAVGEGVFVDGADFFGLDGGDADAGQGVESVDLDFVVEVANVADDGLVFHPQHVFEGDDVAVARGGDVDVGYAKGVFDGEDSKAFHGSLEGTDGVDFCDDDVGAHAAQGLGAAFADIAVAADDGGFAGDHDVGGAFEAVQQGFATAVEVVEFGFGDGVVDVDGREQEFAGLGVSNEAFDSGGGFFADSSDVRNPAVKDAGVVAGDALEEVFEDLFFAGFGGGVDPGVAFFHFVAFVEEEGGVSAVVHDELGALVARVAEGTPGAFPVLFKGFAFPGKYGDAACGDGGGSMVLGGIDVAGGPAYGGSKVGEGFDEYGGLDGHVEGAGDAGATEGLLGAVFGTQGHEAGHFVFGHFDFSAAKVS